MGVYVTKDVTGRVLQVPLKIEFVNQGRPFRQWVVGGQVQSRHFRPNTWGSKTAITINFSFEQSPQSYIDNRAEVEKEAYSVLIHEITHLMDMLPQIGHKDSDDDYVYYNRPTEVRAFMQQIVDEIQGASSVPQALAMSKTWKRIGWALKPESKKLILKAVYQAVMARRVATRTANYFSVGEHITYGKYHNKAGIIKGFKKDEKGNPVVVIEPFPKGRKQDKEIQLFHIWKPQKVKVAATVTHEQLKSFHSEFIKQAAELVRMVIQSEDPRDFYRAPHQYITFCNAGHDYVKALMVLKSPPKGKAKAAELAIRTFMSFVKTKDIKAWLVKNNPRFKVLMFEALEWPDKVEGDSVFNFGSFKVYNDTLGVDIEGVKKNLAKAEEFIRRGHVPLGIGKVLYGDIHVTPQVHKSANTMAFYTKTDDTLYIRPNQKWSAREVHNVIHELGHRYLHKFADHGRVAKWNSLHMVMGMGNHRVPVEKFPKVGESIGIPIKGVGDDPIVIKIEGTPGPWAKYYVTDTGYVKGEALAKNLTYPTPYASTSPAEHFCEALAMFLMGTLPEEHKAKFLEIWG
jgi:hypothetical protein